MDNKTLTKEMLKDFYASKGYYERNIEQCPFMFGRRIVKYSHDCCAVLFPGWAKNHYKDGDKKECPCTVMGKRYIRRKTREFVKKNK